MIVFGVSRSLLVNWLLSRLRKEWRITRIIKLTRRSRRIYYASNAYAFYMNKVWRLTSFYSLCHLAYEHLSVCVFCMDIILYVHCNAWINGNVIRVRTTWVLCRRLRCWFLWRWSAAPAGEMGYREGGRRTPGEAAGTSEGEGNKNKFNFDQSLQGLLSFFQSKKYYPIIERLKRDICACVR